MTSEEKTLTEVRNYDQNSRIVSSYLGSTYTQNAIPTVSVTRMGTTTSPSIYFDTSTFETAIATEIYNSRISSVTVVYEMSLNSTDSNITLGHKTCVKEIQALVPNTRI